MEKKIGRKKCVMCKRRIFCFLSASFYVDLGFIYFLVIYFRVLRIFMTPLLFKHIKYLHIKTEKRTYYEAGWREQPAHPRMNYDTCRILNLARGCAWQRKKEEMCYFGILNNTLYITFYYIVLFYILYPLYPEVVPDSGKKRRCAILNFYFSSFIQTCRNLEKTAKLTFHILFQFYFIKVKILKIFYIFLSKKSCCALLFNHLFRPLPVAPKLKGFDNFPPISCPSNPHDKLWKKKCTFHWRWNFSASLLQCGFKEFILEISKCRESSTVCHNTLIYDDRRSLIVGIAEKEPKQLVQCTSRVILLHLSFKYKNMILIHTQLGCFWNWAVRAHNKK